MPRSIPSRELRCLAGVARITPRKAERGNSASTKALIACFTFRPAGAVSARTPYQAIRLTLFNDPVCHDKVGRYTWIVKNSELTFQEIDDPCAIHLRAVNLTRQPWSSCQPPNAEAAVTDHWLKPAGCPDTAVP